MSTLPLRWQIIANPSAGSFDPALLQIASTLRDTTVHRIGETPSLPTVKPDTGIAALGGDGTLHRVINHYGSAHTFGLVPSGTGNDFARTLGIDPLDPRRALEHLRSGRNKAVDLFQVKWPNGERLGVNALAGGFAIAVDEQLTPELKERLGPLAYLVAAARAALAPTVYRLRLVINEGERIECDAYNLTVSNGRCIAGGIPIAGSACVDDGSLDVLIVPALPAIELAALTPKILRGEVAKDLRFIARRARRLQIESDPPLPFNIDGEEGGSTPFEVSVLQHPVHFVVPST